MGPRELAVLLAKEAAYRSSSGSRVARLGPFTLSTAGIVRSNVAWAVLFSAFSVIVVLSTGPLSCSLILSIGFLGVLELFIGAFFMASTVHAITSMRLLDPLARTPIDDKTLRLALLGASAYWGGVAIPAVVLPGAAAAAWLVRSPLLICWAFFEALCLALAASGLGYLAGALYPRARGSRALRAASLIAWVAFFGLGATFNLALARGWLARSDICPPQVGLIPPFSFPAAALNAPTLALNPALSSLAFSAFSVWVAWYGAGKLWRAISSEWIPLPTIEPARRAKQVTIPSAIPYLIVKDLKLLARNPKMLASVLYYLSVGPLVILATLTWIGPEHPAALAVISPVALLVGGLSGWAAMYLITLEGTGAGFLASLPISERELAELKTRLTVLIGSPASFGFYLVARAAGHSTVGLASALAYLASLYSSSRLTCVKLIRRLGQERKVWTLHAMGKELILLLLSQTALFVAMALMAYIPAILVPEQAWLASSLMSVVLSFALAWSISHK